MASASLTLVFLLVSVSYVLCAPEPGKKEKFIIHVPIKYHTVHHYVLKKIPIIHHIDHHDYHHHHHHIHPEHDFHHHDHDFHHDYHHDYHDEHY
ncbi:uncharacterized protein LOC142329386 [Lycorma delicatula]|uniref:uncharacterized protein LOC142329386 n=1 Tax=Lycorma delicatula TaxID=130591 RepID=UPI003F518D25